MPPDSERYYGFGYFAIQLNELLESEKDRLPCTDCRFRPDQRMLENGEVQDADVEKKHVEQVRDTSVVGTALLIVYHSFFTCSYL